MSALTDLKSQKAQAACFYCLPVNTSQAIKTYLLAVLAGGSTDPKTLMAQAGGFWAIPSGILQAVQLVLIETASGTVTDPLTEIQANPCTASCVSPVDSLAIQLLLLAQKAGVSTDPKTLAKLAACFACIPSGWQAVVQSFLLAVIVGVIPPPGLTLPPPGTSPPILPAPILKKAIKGFALPPMLVEGMIIDGVPGLPGGVFQCPAIAVGAVLLDTMESYPNLSALNGSNGGSGWCKTSAYVDRTAYLGLQALDTMESYTNGANLLGLNGGTGWSGAYGADNISVQLDSSQQWPANGSTTTITATASNGFPAYSYQWNKNGVALTNAGHYSGVTTATLTITGYTAADDANYTCTVSDTTGRSTTSLACATLLASTNGQLWASTVAITNGGPWPSASTVNAFDTWDAAVTTAGIRTKLYHVNLIAPDSLIAALTPFIHVNGNSLWTKHVLGAPPAESITVNGLKAATNDANGTIYDLGFAPNAVGAFSTSNAGVSAYCADAVAPATFGDFTGCFDGAAVAIGVQANNSGHALGIGWSTGHLINVAHAAIGGMYSYSRVSTTNAQLYFANSGNAWASLATDATLEANGPNAQNCGACGEIRPAGVFVANPSRISFVAYHDGLSSANGQALFNAVQTLRTTLGGGFV